MKFSTSLICLYFFIDQVLNDVLIGPYPIRVYFHAGLILLCFTIWSKKTIFINRKLKNMLNIYSLYLIIFFVNSFINGDFSNFPWVSKSLSEFLPCFFIPFLITTEVRKEISVYKVSVFLLFFGAVNAMVSVLQYLGEPITWIITEIINTGIAHLGNGFYTYGGSALGFNKLPLGLSSFSVSNGYFLCSFYPIFLFFIKSKSKIFLVTAIIGIIMTLWASLFLQQRTSLFLILLTSIMFILKSNLKLLVIPIVIVGSYYFVTNFYTIIESFTEADGTNRLAKLGNPFEDKARGIIYLLLFDFLSKNFLFGGMTKFLSHFPIGMSAFTPHNQIFNAWLYGGMAGLITMFSLFYISLKNLGFICYKTYRDSDLLTFGYSMGAISYLLNSLTHNGGFTSGSTLVWWLISLAFVSYSLQNDLTLKASSIG